MKNRGFRGIGFYIIVLIILIGTIALLYGSGDKNNYVYSQIVDSVNNSKKNVMAGQLSLFDIVSDEDKKDFEMRLPDLPEFDRELLLAFEKKDFMTLFSAVSACLNNVGPGFSEVGAVCSYSSLTPLTKVTLTFDMLFGRLELVPMLVLFTPSIWTKNRSKLQA